jgi:hypothetical protein
MQLGNSRNSMQRGLASQLRLKANYDRKKVVKPRIPVIPRLISEPLPSPAAEDIARKTLAELEPGDCRFIPFEPTGRCFCALPVLPGTSYCPHHFIRTHQGAAANLTANRRETTEVMA